MNKSEASQHGSANAQRFLQRLRKEAEDVSVIDPKLEAAVREKACLPSPCEELGDTKPVYRDLQAAAVRNLKRVASSGDKVNAASHS